MSRDEQAQYHSDRAMQELDQGLTAASTSAARAHLTLSSLHLQRAQDLDPMRPENKPTQITS